MRVMRVALIASGFMLKQPVAGELGHAYGAPEHAEVANCKVILCGPEYPVQNCWRSADF